MKSGMLYIRLIIISSLILLLPKCISAADTSNCGVIPKVAKCLAGDGEFKFNHKTVIVTDNDCKDVGRYLQETLQPAMGYQIKIRNRKPSDNYITITVDESLELGPEGYTLSVNKNRICIVGKSPAGVFYGVQTLRQLLDSDIFCSSPIKKDWVASSVEISDEPRFEWRGMHLDVCRHFMPVEFVKKYIDLMAMHKMNKFHWHLTEDQGWRIEIKKYPKLTEIGAWRDETLIGYSLRPKEEYTYDGKKHGGFYTQEEIREIIAYAASRFIEIIPEIEMPGHATAALASYPEFSCRGEIEGVGKYWGIYHDVFCVGNEKTFDFLQGILDEVTELFPSRYVHIGGDECPRTRWKECALCQKRIQEEGLANENELQTYFEKRIKQYLDSKGKTTTGWEEILDGGPIPGVVLMSWRSEEAAIKGANAGHYVVLSPTDYCYLDFYQGPRETEPLAIGGYISLEQAYSFNPIPKELSKDKEKFILGLQGNVWTEYMPVPSHVEYMAYPRAVALAEVGWSAQDNRDYNDFLNRLSIDLKRLDCLKVNYRKP